MRLILFCAVLNFISKTTVVWAAGHKWPSTIKRCAMNDPNLNKCVLKLTEQAIAKMAKGVPAIGLKSLDPLRNASFDVASKTGPVVANVHTSNVMITGPSKVQLKKVHFDKKSSTYFIEGYHPFLKMVGNYNVKGNVLVVPIDSSGTFDLEIRGGFANHSIKMSNNVRSGGHGQVNFDFKNLKSIKIILHDRLLGEEGSAVLTQLINDNMPAVSKALWDPMEKVIQDVYGEALKPLTSKFNVKDFFPVMSSGRSEADEAEAVTEHVERDDVFSYFIQY